VSIHPTAIVDPKAELDETVEVGPYVIIEGGVRIGARTRIMAHAHINGNTTIGEDNVIHMGAVIGHEPQDIGYDGAPNRLVIGDRNTFREYVSIHRASSPETETRVGSDCFLMGFSHIGHDCHVGDRVIVANYSMLGGHAEVQDGVNISGGCAVHQFTRIGRYAMLQGLSGASKDVPPFMTAMRVNRVSGPNIVGLRRAGFSAQARREIRAASKVLFREGNSVPRALEKLRQGGFGPEVQEMIEFIEKSKRGICSHTGE